MEATDAKQMLHRYLQMARDALLWKLADVSEYDVRRPLTPTGTNLLGIVKHLAIVEFGYFGDTFGRPHGERFVWDGHWIMVHMVAETNRHLGHADILREEIDGVVGHRSGVDNLPDVDAEWWPSYFEQVEHVAREASTGGAEPGT